MTPIETIQEHMRQYDAAKIVVSGNHLSVDCNAPDGFQVSFSDLSPFYRVSFDSWHDEFSDLDEALNCFAFGLSKQCRLKIELRGGVEQKWTVQSWENGEWLDDSSVGQTGLQFWKPITVVYRQNTLIDVE